MVRALFLHSICTMFVCLTIFVWSYASSTDLQVVGFTFVCRFDSHTLPPRTKGLQSVRQSVYRFSIILHSFIVFGTIRYSVSDWIYVSSGFDSLTEEA
jgi:hypothetical protein